MSQSKHELLTMIVAAAFRYDRNGSQATTEPPTEEQIMDLSFGMLLHSGKLSEQTHSASIARSKNPLLADGQSPSIPRD